MKRASGESFEPATTQFLAPRFVASAWFEKRGRERMAISRDAPSCLRRAAPRGALQVEPLSLPRSAREASLKRLIFEPVRPQIEPSRIVCAL